MAHVLGLLAQNVEHYPRSEIELIQQGIGWTVDRAPERCQRRIRKVPDVGGDDRVSPSTHRRRGNVRVVGVREREGHRQALPAIDSGVLEGSVHSREPLGHEVRCEVR